MASGHTFDVHAIRPQATSIPRIHAAGFLKLNENRPRAAACPDHSINQRPNFLCLFAPLRFIHSWWNAEEPEVSPTEYRTPMKTTLSAAIAALLALGMVEALAWWWMNPRQPSASVPLLAYQPPRSTPAPGNAAAGDADILGLDSPAHAFPSVIPLPAIYQQAAPMLRCSTGEVFHLRISDTAGMHVAFFEWDAVDTGSVLEAFRHMPEACMGAIGMQLVSRQPPIRFDIDDQSLLFDHTIFREPHADAGPLAPQPLIHAFRAVWVAGTDHADARQGIHNRGFDQLRSIRIHAARTRFRPGHARVIQAAVRGIPDPDLAWLEFQNHILTHLTLTPAQQK